MDAKKLVGPKAGSLKYDLLTAINVAGLHGSPGFQTSMTRLTALVTARYNWRLDELSVGQRDMARLWGVNERTVKREIKRLTDGDILICKRQGVRGRVGAYRLNYAEIYRCSRPTWAMVGPDFEERMSEFLPDVSASVVKVDFGKPSPEAEIGTDDINGFGQWRHVLQHLKKADASLYQNWFKSLTMVEFSNGLLRVNAPSKFVARYIETHFLRQLSTSVGAVMGPVNRIEFTTPPG